MKNRINFSLPSYLSNLNASEDGKRTTAQLKAFYKGETSDGRVFTDEFAEKLAETLPNTPVVAYYDEEAEDFKGHNKVQYVYGIVPADAEFGFEKDDEGVDWLVTEVLLYTDRVDNIGEVAKKIVGQPHSLEMNPATAKYEFIKEDGKRKIKFLEADLIGLSVLGTEETPAMTGSTFFKESLPEMKEQFENFFSYLSNKEERGIINMDKTIQPYLDFLSSTYSEKMDEAYKALSEKFKDDAMSIGLVDMSDTYVIYLTYDWNSGNIEYYRANYEMQEGDITLSEGEKVRMVYVTDAEYEKLNMAEGAGENEEDAEQDEEEDDTAPENQEANGDESDDSTTASIEAERAELEAYKSEAEGRLRDYEATVAELSVELAAYKTKEKEELLESFKDVLGEEEIKSFKLEDYKSYEELEIALSLAFTRKRKEAAPAVPLAFSLSKEDKTDNSLDALVKKYKNI